MSFGGGQSSSFFNAAAVGCPPPTIRRGKNHFFIFFFFSFMRLGWVVKKQNKKASAYIGFVPLPMEFQRRRSANHFLLLQLLPAKDAKFSHLNHFEGEKAQNNKGRRNIYTTGAAYSLYSRARPS